jgi:acetyl-CoA carboxylase biotin carboxyl carrier protein
MLSYEQILELIDKLVETPLSEISLAQGEFSMSLKKETSRHADNLSTTVLGMPPAGYQAVIPTPQGLAQAANTLAPTQTAPATNNLIEITSPMVGTFYAAPSPDSPAFVEIGKKVNPGDVLCIIEAMKMMNELPSEISGTIEEICVKNAATVEFGQVLFRINPN